jgi:hypothetical protein
MSKEHFATATLHPVELLFKPKVENAFAEEEDDRQCPRCGTIVPHLVTNTS